MIHAIGIGPSPASALGMFAKLTKNCSSPSLSESGMIGMFTQIVSLVDEMGKVTEISVPTKSSSPMRFSGDHVSVYDVPLYTLPLLTVSRRSCVWLYPWPNHHLHRAGMSYVCFNTDLHSSIALANCILVRYIADSKPYIRT